MVFVSFNGKLYPSDAPLFLAQNRSFRYGDGLFETLKVLNGQPVLSAFHFDRLWLGMHMLQISQPVGFTREFLLETIIGLCKANDLLQAARVRLAVFRNDDNIAEFVIETIPLPPDANLLNEKGWSLELYPFARKSCDALGNLKTANYLIYILAGLYAKEKAVDECLVLNTENNICDGSKANVFLVHHNEVYTPALHQGCVNGVMRRYLVEQLKDIGITVHQREISEQFLLEADEVFVTNAITGMRWISSYRNKQYRNEIVKDIYQKTVATLFK
ncbi:aminotransferase class IV [Chitinophagaceae bacterium LB-8]|uniref:branched-chain-amino-acid transaminase n=1 Tax=Paraflavisolibacter caeni TaxID=2982496 RepID=A0A9X3BF78_9BACT|nr:aminotransferase class IV [Paraflavisolibacter caeni]MCU7548394.1 aminotransferase class IV [Paraflavisolibacter caeni]